MHTPSRAFIALMVAIGATMCACSLGASSAPKPSSRPFADGETIGKVERTAQDAAAAQQVHTLLSVSCQKSTLVVRTSVETITASTDCARAPLEASLDRMLGLPAVIVRSGDNLRITNPSGTSIEVPAADIMLTERNVTP